jgi:hypothetical protein
MLLMLGWVEKQNLRVRNGIFTFWTRFPFLTAYIIHSFFNYFHFRGLPLTRASSHGLSCAPYHLNPFSHDQLKFSHGSQLIRSRQGPCTAV